MTSTVADLGRTSPPRLFRLFRRAGSPSIGASSTDTRNDYWVYAEPTSKFTTRKFRVIPYLERLSVSQTTKRRRTTQSVLKRVCLLPTRCGPFKVFNAVVSPYTVEVVHGVLRRARTNKGLSYKDMHSGPFFSAHATRQAHSGISVLQHRLHDALDWCSRDFARARMNARLPQIRGVRGHAAHLAQTRYLVEALPANYRTPLFGCSSAHLQEYTTK